MFKVIDNKQEHATGCQDVVPPNLWHEQIDKYIHKNPPDEWMKNI